MPNANGDRAAMAKFPASLFTLAASLWLAVPGASAAASWSLADDALAILEKNCLACHGSARMAGLDLRQRETLLKGRRSRPRRRTRQRFREPVVSGRCPHRRTGDAARQRRATARRGPRNPRANGSTRALPGPGPQRKQRQGAEPEWWAFRKPRRPTVPTPAKYANLVQKSD